MPPPTHKRPRLSTEHKNAAHPSAVGNSAAEDALMAALLSGLDESMFEASPSPSKSQAQSSSSTKRTPTLQGIASSPGKQGVSTSRVGGGNTATVLGTRTTVTLSPVRSPRRSRSPVRAVQVCSPVLHGRRKSVSEGAGSRSRSPVKREPVPTVEVGDIFGIARKKVRAEGSATPKMRTGGTTKASLSSPSRGRTAQASTPRKQSLGPSASTIVLPPMSPPTSPGTAECIPSTQDEYDLGWDLDALADMDEATLLQAAGAVRYPIRHPDPPAPPPGYQPTPWARCIVESVHDGLLDALPDQSPSEPVSQWGKTIVVTVDGSRRLVHLKERWADIKVRANDTVNIISPALSGDGTIVVTMKDPATYIVHHPDVLVTMTAIANAIPCPRRPLLQSLARLPEPPSKAMLYGNVLHSLLQGSLQEQSFDPESTRRRIEAEVGKSDQRLQVWGAGLDEASVIQDLSANAQEAFAAFGRKWVGSIPQADGGIVTARDEPAGTLAITGLHDVEEDIWSVKWGLKGKVDASVQVRLKRDSGEEEELVAPLEIKTGRSIGGVRHRAQTLLYTLLMQDRYGIPVPSGLLYYSQRDAVVLVDARPNEVRALMMARNELADWMARPRVARSLSTGDGSEAKTASNATEEAFLPETIDRLSECKNCYASDLCMLYRKAVDHVPAPADDELFELYDEKTMHLTPKHAAFFAHWERLLTLEEHDTTRLRAQLWTMAAQARQRSGRCFADMVIAEEQSEVGRATKISRWSYTFVRSEEAAPQSLLSGHIARGDPVSLSMEPDIICLARGFVTQLSPGSITVSVQAQLDVEKLLKRIRKDDSAKPVWRIDKDELTSGMQRMRGNLAQMFVKNGDERCRTRVVDLAKPKFDPTYAPKPHEIPDYLNEDQQAAMTKVLTAKDYALILGMPGTGKTTIVAAIIRAIVARGQTVLLTSYTHSAVDTIVTKLLGSEFEVLRIGNPDKVHPDVKHLTFDAQPVSNTEELERRLMGPQVVATTALSIEHPLFFRRRFDYCIVDEASQITLPTCVGPLRCADKFVLVGDHFQLPPIVRRAEARQGGLDVSLFRRLSDAHPEAVAPLAAQYRMNSDIMLLSNQLIYENRLRCGSDEVANQVLVLPSPRACRDDQGRDSSCQSSCWIQTLITESVKAIFVDTDNLPARESRAGDLVQNETEASMVHALASAFVDCGVEERDMAVITPYRQQIKLLSKLFHAQEETKSVEILTADKAQGRDKDVIFISLVRSNEDGNVGDLLRDWRRINVSFTRAKRKLIIFGSRATLGTNALLRDFFSLMEGKGWILKLPRGAEELHRTAAAQALSQQSAAKRDSEKATSGGGSENEPKRGKMSERVLSGRPFVREVLQEMNV